METRPDKGYQVHQGSKKKIRIEIKDQSREPFKASLVLFFKMGVKTNILREEKYFDFKTIVAWLFHPYQGFCWEGDELLS